MIRRSLPLVLSALLGLVVAGCGIFGGGDGGGQDPKDPRPCDPQPDQQFSSSNLAVIRYEPRNCPYTVATVGAQLPFHVWLVAPANRINNAVTAQVTIYDAGNVQRFHQFASYQSPDPNPTQLFADFQGTYSAGNHPANVAIKDKAFLCTPLVNPLTTACATLYIPGNISSVAAYMNGPASVDYNLPTTWRVVPQKDSISYTYQWQLNGQDIVGATGATLRTNMPDVGTYSLGVTVYRSDYSTELVTKSVSGVFTASISGPGALPDGSTGHYDASIPGGQSPFTYQWTVDGFGVGNGSNLDQYFYGEGSSHTVGLTVTDSRSHVATSSVNVYVTGSGGCIICPP